VKPGSTNSASAMKKLDPLSVMSILDERNAKGGPLHPSLTFSSVFVFKKLLLFYDIKQR
jgi:hypothetical protein